MSVYHRELLRTHNSRSSWLPALSMMLVSFISYVDRNTLAILAPTILRDTHLNAEQYGFIISCFSVAYMIGNPVWGILLDRWGVRRGMNIAVSIWSVAAAAHAWASGLVSFGIARAILGAGEGATFPGGLRTVTQTLPPEKRGRGLALAYSGGSLGAIITPFIVTPIALRFGWHGAFLVTGSFGILWLVLWRFISPRVEQPVIPRAARTSMPWKNPALAAYVAAYALGAMPLGMILYSSSIYLHTRFGWDQAMLGKVLWIPPLGWEISYFVWGTLLDKYGPRYKGLMFTSLLLTIPLAWTHSLPSGEWVLASFFLAMFAVAGFVVLSVSWAARVFPPEHTGLLSGIGAGSWSAVVAVTSPILGRLFDQGHYETAFRSAVACSVLGYLLWRWFSSRGNGKPGLLQPC